MTTATRPKPRAAALAILVVLGLGWALGLARATATFLYAITRRDPMTHVASAILLAVVAGSAAYWPARPAARLDPVDALRAE